MNGKIKTKFAALFAVALMITVCVVPMVGNDYGEAETITVPVDTKALTIAGTVFDVDGTTGIIGAEVIITVTIGKDESTYTVKTSGENKKEGTYSCEILVPEKTIIDEIEVKVNTSAKLIEDDEEIDNPAAGLWSSEPTLTVSGVDVEELGVDKEIGGLDFKAGYVAWTIDTVYTNSTYNSTKGEYDYKYKVQTTVTLVEYGTETVGDNDTEVTNEIASVTDSDATDVRILYIPAGHVLTEDYTGYRLVAEGFESVDIASADLYELETYNLKADNLYAVKVDFGTPKVGTKVSIKAESEDIAIVGANNSIYKIDISADDEDVVKYIEIVKTDKTPGEGEKTLTISVSDNNDYGTEDEYSLADINKNIPTIPEIDYVLDRYISGIIYMDFGTSQKPVDIPLVNQPVMLTMNIQPEDDEGEVEVINLLEDEIYTDSEGKFTYWYGDLDYTEGDIKAIVYFNEEEYEFDATLTKDTNTFDVDGEILSSGFNYIFGTINGAAEDSEVEIVISGEGVVGANNKGKLTVTAPDYKAVVKNGSKITITPDADYSYDVSSVQVNVTTNSSVNFTMNSQEFDISFVDYLGEPLSGVEVYKRAYDDEGKLVILDDEAEAIATSVDGKATLSLPGNEDLSKYFVSFIVEGYTFEYGADAAIALEDIDGAFKVLEVRKDIKVIDADGNKIALSTADGNELIKTYSAYVKNGVEVFDVKATPVYDLQWDALNKTYYFVGLVGDQEISSTANDILAIVIPNTVTGIFDPIYPIDEDGVTVIQSYRNTVTGTIYEADEKTVITTMGGTNVSFYSDASATAITKQIKKDGTFVINTYGDIDEDSYITIGSNKYTFIGEDDYKHKVIGEDGKPVTKFYADQMSFEVSFADADGKAITGYSSATVANSSVDVETGIVIFTVPENKIIAANNLLATGGERTFNPVKLTESMISSKKVDFVSKQATYTVKLTDSADKMWDLESDMEIWSVTDTVNVLEKEFTVQANKGEASVLMDVPQDGETYVVKAELATYFGTQEYAFTDYAVTVPAIGSFVEVTAAEANGTLFASDVINSATVYVKGETTGVSCPAEDNVVRYFAIDGKEYEFAVIDSSDDYSFGNINVNDGKISAVNGLLLANEETVKGQVTFANGYNVFDAFVGLVGALDDEDSPLDMGEIDDNGMYKVIVDLDKVVKYSAMIAIDNTQKSHIVVAEGSSSTSNVALDESYITGAVPTGATVNNIAMYSGDVFVKYLDNYGGTEEYVLVVDVSEGNKVVMTITAGTKTFQQAIDLKAVQNNIIVPGTLVSDKTDALFADYYVIYGADTAVIGSKIVLSAKNAVSIQMDVNNVAYKTFVFDGWYVNGEKVSDDVNATYTVNGPCEVYAYYTEKVTETGAVADSSNDLSMDVLILGIIIVVLALLAFVYAVKFKKE